MRYRSYLYAMTILFGGALAYTLSGDSPAQVVNPGGGVTAADLAAVQSQIPVPAATVPGMETVGGSAGTGGTYRPGNAIQPRITRTASCALTVTAGISSCTAVWDGSAFPNGTTIRLAGQPAVIMSGQGTAADQPVTCSAYNVTTTGISFRCWAGQTTALNLSIITAGLSLFPFIAQPAGATVQVTAIPSS